MDDDFEARVEAELLRAGEPRALAAPTPVSRTGPSREAIDAWLQANCGAGIPFHQATDQTSMLHGLAYILRQIESTGSYMVFVGQTGPATSALRAALDHFAIRALSATATEGE